MPASTIISSKVRHQLCFAPSPTHDAFPTRPVFVETRAISDVAVYPEGVRYAFFFDVVETRVQLPDGSVKTLYGDPFNEQTYLVRCGREELEQLANHWPDPVDVHPNLAGQVYVIPCQ